MRPLDLCITNELSIILDSSGPAVLPSGECGKISEVIFQLKIIKIRVGQ